MRLNKHMKLYHPADRKKFLAEQYEIIQEALEVSGPYSHNIISICLREIANKMGVEKANQVLVWFELDKLGWSKQPEGVTK